MATAPGWAGQSTLGPWFVQPETGTIQRQTNPVLAAGLAVLWVGFSTEADAKAFASGNVVSTVKNDAGAAESAASAVPDFLSRLTSANLWIRVGEVIAGLILLGIGLNAMLKGRPLQVVTGAAGVAGKAAML
jgi:hypothetical protein